MARAIDYPRHGKIKATGQHCIVTGETSQPGTPCYTVKFSKRGKEVTWSTACVIVYGKYDPIVAEDA